MPRFPPQKVSFSYSSYNQELATRHRRSFCCPLVWLPILCLFLLLPRSPLMGPLCSPGLTGRCSFQQEAALLSKRLFSTTKQLLTFRPGFPDLYDWDLLQRNSELLFPFTLQPPECEAFGGAIMSFVNCTLQVLRNSALKGLCVMLLSYTAQTKLLQNPPAEMDPGDVT